MFLRKPTPKGRFEIDISIKLCEANYNVFLSSNGKQDIVPNYKG